MTVRMIDSFSHLFKPSSAVDEIEAIRHTPIAQLFCFVRMLPAVDNSGAKSVVFDGLSDREAYAAVFGTEQWLEGPPLLEFCDC